MRVAPLPTGSRCKRICATTPGCTHYTFKPEEDGLCWLQTGAVGRGNAYYTPPTASTKGQRCGLLSKPKPAVQRWKDVEGIYNFASRCGWESKYLKSVKDLLHEDRKVLSGKGCGPEATAITMRLCEKAYFDAVDKYNFDVHCLYNCATQFCITYFDICHFKNFGSNAHYIVPCNFLINDFIHPHYTNFKIGKLDGKHLNANHHFNHHFNYHFNFNYHQDNHKFNDDDNNYHDSRNACSYIINTILPRYTDSNDATAATNLHNEIRSYVALRTGRTIPPLTWSQPVVDQSLYDAQWSVQNSNCAAGALAHSPTFGNGVRAKSLGWKNFVYSIKLFVTYDDGRGSECAQWFANPGGLSHFGNIVGSGSTRLGCAAAVCPGGRFGDVIGCDYA
ncbi:hypothetical protein HDU77_010012 [Chytriomyces hyalinus]|nr:hypothetical protein HDU77_010012 [Chytriomyces hyalinus]